MLNFKTELTTPFLTVKLGNHLSPELKRRRDTFTLTIGKIHPFTIAVLCHKTHQLSKYAICGGEPVDRGHDTAVLVPSATEGAMTCVFGRSRTRPAPEAWHPSAGCTRHPPMLLAATSSASAEEGSYPSMVGEVSSPNPSTFFLYLLLGASAAPQTKSGIRCQPLYLQVQIFSSLPPGTIQIASTILTYYHLLFFDERKGDRQYMPQA